MIVPDLKLKTGKLPKSEDDRDVYLGDFLNGPNGRLADCGNYALIDGQLYDFDFPWGMLGNDKVGDCVEAWSAHSQMLDEAEGKRRVPGFAEKGVIADYSAATGYDGKPATDKGTEVRAYLGYRRKTGIVDANSKRHKIGMYAAVDHTEIREVVSAVKALGKVTIGFEVPNYAMEQFNRTEPFDLSPSGDDTIDGGHCVGIVGILNGYFVVSTWGTLALMSPAFFSQYADEAWGYISGAMLDPEGLTVSGLDVEKCRAFMAGLEGTK